MNEETYRLKNYEIELQKLTLANQKWFWQRGVWVASVSIALTALLYEISGKGFS